MVTASPERTYTPGYSSNGRSPSKPTLDEIMALHREGSAYYHQFHGQCKTEEDYYLGRRHIPVPEGIDPVWPATATSIINVATDHVDVNNLSIDVPSSSRSRARAERIKKFYQGAWLSIKEPVLRTAVRQTFLYGITFLKTMFDADRWPDAPKYEAYGDDLATYKKDLQEFLDVRSISFPFVVRPINPRNMIWDDSKTRMKWAIQFTEKSVKDISRRYPEWVPKADGGQKAGIAQWLEYWDEEWCAYIADGQFVYGPEKHGYGFMPFTPIYPVQSFTFEEGRPEDRYKGILWYAHNLLDEEARLMSQIGSIIRTTAWRTLDFHGPQQMAQKAADEYEMFGGKNVVPPGVTVAISPMSQVPPDLYQHLNIVQTSIEQVTFPNVIRGMRPRGVSAGFAISVLSGMGRLVFQGVADGTRHAVELVNGNLGRLVVNKLKGRVTVSARTEAHAIDQTIEPGDWRDMYENTVQIKAEAPEEREREALLAMRLYQGLPGGFPMYEALRRAGITNPLEAMMERRAEDLTLTPEFLQAQMGELMRRINLPGQMAEAMGGPGGNVGNMNMGGAQLQRPGEAAVQRQRVQSRNENAMVFPQGMGGLDQLAGRLGQPGGGATPMPSGQTVR